MNDNDYCNAVDATSGRGGLVFRVAGWAIGGLLALATVGLVGTLAVTAVGIVRGWVA